MKRLLLIVITSFIAMTGFSQTAHFSYDASGNRISRWLEAKEVKLAEADTLLPNLRPTDNPVLLSEINVYPNPVKQNLQIDINRLEHETIRGYLCDISGRTTLSFSRLTSNNSINIESLAPGTYLLKIECKGECRIWKLIKE
ncbi:MAG: T9SS type A sorting domain-containing protein [Sphingobacteriia bacterium]|nr:T9SS type A sorting domain-containing protein [Sphingobacteriia bacterium]